MPVTIGVVLVLASSICHAQSLNYKTAVAEALRHSPNLRMKVEDISISNAQYKTSFAGLFPTVSLSGRAERYENLDRRENTNIETIGNEVVGGYQTAWRSSLNVSGQYNLSHWYKKRYEAQYYEKIKDSTVHQCEAEAKKIIREVTDLYASLVEAKTKYVYAEKILHHLRQIERIKKEAFAVGQYSFEEVLKAETEVTSMEKEMVKIKKDLSDQLHRLSGYTGGGYSEATTIDGLDYRGEIAAVDEKKAVAAAPEYKTRLMEMEALRSKAVASRNSLFPDISVYGRYDLFNSSPDSLDASFRDTRPSSYSAGVIVSIPLFDGGAKYWEWKKSTYEIRKQQESIRAAMEECNKNIKTLSDGYQNMTRSYLHLQKLDAQYKKMTAIGRKAQTLGERSLLDMLELEKDALAMERDMKIAQQNLAVYEVQMALELDYNTFVREYDGNRACRN